MSNSESRTEVRRSVEERWPTAEDFYNERDDRTRRNTPGFDQYATCSVEILIDPATANTRTAQQIALVACNLTARWARAVTIVIPADVLIAKGLDRGSFPTLKDRLQFEMAGADPFGHFEFVSIGNYKHRPDEELFRLFIGSWEDPQNAEVLIEEDDFLIWAVGEYAIGRRGEPLSSIIPGEDFTPAAALAASIGAADLFKRAIGHSREQWISSFNWNLIDHSLNRDVGPSRPTNSGDNLDIGRVLLAGVGAIGSSLVYMLDLAGVVGDITLLDRDRVETSNLNRSLLFDVSHVLSNAHKTELASNFLSSSGIPTRRLDGTWREHSAAISTEPFDVWISFTNEDGAWAQVPFQLPPIVLQGTTTSGWGFGAGRHIPRKEDCTLCRMPRPEAVFRGPCAEGEIDPAKVEGPPMVASLPFLSAASASLVLAELLKLGLSGVEMLPNDVSADLKTGFPAVVSVIRQSDENCRGCQIVNSDMWHDRGGRGRYNELSQ